MKDCRVRRANWSNKGWVYLVLCSADVERYLRDGWEVEVLDDDGSDFFDDVEGEIGWIF